MQIAKYKTGESLFYLRKAGNGYVIARSTVIGVKQDEVSPLYLIRHKQDNGHETVIHVAEHNVARTPVELINPILNAVVNGRSYNV